MSKIRGKNTKVELAVFRGLRKKGIYFQKYYRSPAGTPDIVLPGRRKRFLSMEIFGMDISFRNSKKDCLKNIGLERLKGI